MFCFMAKEKLHNGQYWLIAAVIIFAALLISISGFDPIQQRMSILKEGFIGRWLTLSDSLNIFKNFPLFGIGLDNFKYVFTMYQRSKQFAIYYDYPHNDYLQFLLESGLVCTIVLSVFFFNLFKNLFIELNRRHDPFVKSIVIGGMSGLLGVIVHSFVDFNFHVPAVALLFWLLLGLIYKCVYTHFYPSGVSEHK